MAPHTVDDDQRRADQIAAALRAGCTGPLDQAAIYILTSLPALLARQDIERYFASWRQPDGSPAMRPLWHALWHATQAGEIPLPSDEWQMLLLACSLGDGTPASLVEALSGLDTVSATVVISAVGLALGRRP